MCALHRLEQEPARVTVRVALSGGPGAARLLGPADTTRAAAACCQCVVQRAPHLLAPGPTGPGPALKYRYSDTEIFSFESSSRASSSVGDDRGDIAHCLRPVRWSGLGGPGSALTWTVSDGRAFKLLAMSRKFITGRNGCTQRPVAAPRHRHRHIIMIAATMSLGL